MNLRPRLALYLITALLAAGRLASAQDQPNISNYIDPASAYHTGDIDYVDVLNGRVALNIPLVIDHSQRGNLNFTYSLRYAATTQWGVVNLGGQAGWAWRPANSTITSPHFSMDGDLLIRSETIDCSPYYYCQADSARDENGSIHYLGTTSGIDGNPPFTGESVDGSGIAEMSSGSILTNPQGIQFVQIVGDLGDVTAGSPAYIQDPNGNRLSFSCSDQYHDCSLPSYTRSMTDTVGRVWNYTAGGGNLTGCPGSPVKSDIWDIPGPNGQTRQFKFCYSNIQMSTQFGEQGVQEDYGTAQLMTAAILPDGTMWQLDYDNYGAIHHVYFPTGGTITYGWTTTTAGANATHTLSSRTRFDGANSSTWTYNGFKVTDPVGAGNDTVYTPQNPSNVMCDERLNSVKYYSGSSGSGTLLKTVIYPTNAPNGTNGYKLLNNPYPQEVGACTVSYLPSAVETQWSNGATNETAQTYDTGFLFTDSNTATQYQGVYGLVTQENDYDYGSNNAGPVLSTTNTVYYYQQNSNYESATENLLNFPYTRTVMNGATQMAQTQFVYDENNGSPQCICGNLTSVTQWLNGGTSPKTQYVYNSNGMVIKKADPIDLNRSNPTQYTYDGTGAFLSQIQYPTTNGVSHIEHFVFDSNTGLMTQSTDENGTSNPTNYSYDCMLRPLSIGYPDGGLEAVTYNYSGGAPCAGVTGLTYTGATYTKKINASLTLSQNSLYDGLGRLTHTQLTSDPEGTDYTDTTYDSDGRVYSVSNPYRSTNDSTYGLTQYQYDPLNRVTAVIEPDLSAVTTSYSGGCATVTDEALLQRTTCTDGLQRLTEVDEPSAPGAPASSGSGSATVSGSENSVPTGGPGSQGPYAVGTGADAGNGLDVWTSPGNITTNNSNTPATVVLRNNDTHGGWSDYLNATNFHFSLPSNTTSINGIQVNVTAANNQAGDTVDFSVLILKGGVQTGSDHALRQTIISGYNVYSYGGSTDTWGVNWTGLSADIDNSGFGVAFQYSENDNINSVTSVIYATITVWYTTPTGTTYDTGTVWVNVNGVQMSTNYGQGSTSPSVASSLASSINGNGSSPVTASSSGTTVTLTAKTTGTTTNYPLSAGWTYNQTLFSSPSFTVSVSGSDLSGGYDAGGALTASTFYQYDALSNLIRVDQKNGDSNSADWRTRTFTYDSLSRLQQATNPESGTICYGTYSGSTCQLNGYDPNGNLTYKTDARGITTTYAYDALNRLTQKSYNDGLTATVQYGYDAVPPANCSPSLAMVYPIGRRTAMCDAAGNEAWSYDKMGRAATDQRTTNGVTKPTVYVYNLDGSILSIGYPSGRTVTYAPSAAARMLSAVDTTYSVNYATSALYTPAGAVRSMSSGTLFVYNYFNSRLQPCRFAVNTLSGTPASCADSNKGNVMDFSYNFGLGADNGNVLSIANNITAGRSLTAAYDALNRIESAYTTTWSEQYGMDLWGNLTTISAMPGKPAGENLSRSATTQNRFASMSYDAAGNLLNDGSIAYTYDAENRISYALRTYTYDGDGRRVTKSNSGGVSKIWWYGMGSDPLDETDGTGSTTNSGFSEYVFFNGKRIARRDSAGNVFYYFADHLGTSREIVQAGQTSPCYDADFYPFGKEIISTNTCPQNYKFTGKERDSESGLDNFGARYDSSQYGRFMTPDDIGPGQHPEDPQTWNMYSYVRNNPLSLMDPTGQYICDSNSVSQQQCDNFQSGLDKAQQAANNLKSQYGADSDQYKNAQGAIDAYGKEGVDNGVTIAQGNTGNYAAQTQVAGTTVTSTTDNPNGQNIRVTLDQSLNLLGGTTNTADLGVLEAHEGSHVADASAWVSSGFSPSMNPTGYQTESKAYQVSANLYNALGYMAATVSFAGRSYLLTSTLPAWTSNYTTTAINGIIKNEYPNANLAAFSRNTKLPRR